MSEQHGVPEQARLSSTQRSNLVAYLDGELAADENEDLDRILARSHTARREVELLTRTWEMLDLLPHPRVPEDFSTRTLERIETEALKQQLRGEKWLRSGRRAALGLGWVVSVAAAALAGFLVMYWWPSDSRALLEDLPVIEDLDEYRAVGDFEFLQQLHRRGEFRSDVEEPREPTGP
jgi:anti-sigma factor RsiW